MFCPKCGSEIQDNSKFCGACGEQLGKEEHGTERASKEKKKKSHKSVIWLLGIAAVIGIAVGIKIFVMSESNAYVYYADGKYQLVTDPDSGEAIEIDEGDIAGVRWSDFENDGKYFYYYRDFDEDSGTGTLCRAEYKRLKKNSQKNDKYIETIATNVQANTVWYFKDDTLKYVNGEKTLYYFDGKEKKQIAKNVGFSYRGDWDNKILVYGVGEKECELYRVNLSKPNEQAVKLDDGVSSVEWYNEEGDILYSKLNEKLEESWYLGGVGREAEKIGDDVQLCGYTMGDDEKEKYYIRTADDTNKTLYDFVDDTYAEEDKRIAEPKEADFQIPQYRYAQLFSDDEIKEIDEIYTSCSKSQFFWKSAMDQMIFEECQRFAEKYSALENEEGYFVVTDEIKNDLIEIAEKYGQNYEGEWLEFCFYKEENGTKTDYDAYSAAYNEWDKVNRRNELREELKQIPYSVGTLYCIDNGNVKKLGENILDVLRYNGGIMFNTLDMIEEKIKLEDITFAEEVKNHLALDIEEENYVLLMATDQVYKMPENIDEIIQANEGENVFEFFFESDRIYLNEKFDGTLYMAEIAEDGIGNLEFFEDGIKQIFVDGDKLYGYRRVSEENYTYYYDIYLYEKEWICVAEHVSILPAPRIYEDERILACTGYKEQREENEWSLFEKNGERVCIGTEVRDIIRVDSSTISYISNNDLYEINKKGKRRIAKNIYAYYSKKAMNQPKIKIMY